MDRIPSVDLKDFLSNDPNRKQKFINEIGKAYEDIGFVALKGHFLDDELVDHLYGEIKKFFDLPVEKKRSRRRHGEELCVMFAGENMCPLSSLFSQSREKM